MFTEFACSNEILYSVLLAVRRYCVLCCLQYCSLKNISLVVYIKNTCISAFESVASHGTNYMYSLLLELSKVACTSSEDPKQDS